MWCSYVAWDGCRLNWNWYASTRHRYIRIKGTVCRNNCQIGIVEFTSPFIRSAFPETVRFRICQPDRMHERAETKCSLFRLNCWMWMERAKCEAEIKLHMDYYLLKNLTTTSAARCGKFPLINSWNCSYFITLVLIVWWKIYARVKHHRTKLTRLDSIPANNVFVVVIVASHRCCRGSRVTAATI